MITRYYIGPQIGTGTQDDSYRSLFNDYIDIHIGETFDEIDHPLRYISFCCVLAKEETHNVLRTLSNVLYIGPGVEDIKLLHKLGIPTDDLDSPLDWQQVRKRICDTFLTAQRYRKTHGLLLKQDIETDVQKRGELRQLVLMRKDEGFKFGGVQYGTSS